MTISELSVRRPVTIIMVFVLICVIAAIFVPKIGVALYPSTTMPILSVSVKSGEAGPEEVEEQVTKVLENKLSSISGLQSITSTSAKGQSRVMLEFGYGTDLDAVSSDIESVLSQLSSMLPDFASTPTLMRFDMSSMPILRLMMKGNLTEDALKTIAEETIQPMLERVEGVASVEVMGGASKEVRLSISQNRLQAYGLTISQVISAMDSRNLKSSGGTFIQDGTTYEVVVDELYGSLDEIGQTVVMTASNGVPIRIQDLGDVSIAYESGNQQVYIDGVSGLMVLVSNTTDSNSTTVAKAVRAQVEVINSVLGEGVSLEVLSDDTTLIDSTMSQVYSSAIQGGLLAMLIIFIFLRGVKSTIIIGLSMPISILITLMVMSIAGITINTMSMVGLILGMGMIVDASIVVLENIHGYRLTGQNSAVSAILGSREMFNAIFASTATTLCVFIPVIIYKNELEMMGQMFQDLALTVVISLTASLFVAVTLVPALCGSILRLDTRTQKPLRFKLLRLLDGAMEKGEATLEHGYAVSIRYALRHRLLLITLIGVLLFYTLLQFGGLGMNLTPSMSTDDRVQLSVTLPAGTAQSVTKEYLFSMQKRIEAEVEGYTSIITQVGTGNTGSIQLNLPEIDEQSVTAQEIKDAIRPFFSQWPEATWSFSSGRGPDSSSAVDVEIRSDDSDATLAVVSDIMNILADQVPQLASIESDLSNGDPQIRVDVDQSKAAALGITMSSVGTTLKSAIEGLTASTSYVLNDDTSISLVASLDSDEVVSLNDIGSLLVTGSSGMVRLDSFATFSLENSPKTISREDKQRVNHVTGTAAAGYSATEVQTAVEEALGRALVIPDSVTISYGGEAYRINQFGGSVIMVILVALILVYAVMAAQFESLLDPFIIFTSIPLLLIGVIWIHVFMGASFSLYSAVGIVALAGIVVNNGIVLVDTINRLVVKKIPIYEAIEEAARGRLKPILMTTLTTLLGLVPLAFFPGSGGELMQPIAMTIVGGLVTGAFLTLYLTPMLYSLLNMRRERRFEDPDSLQNQLEMLPSQY